MCDGDGEVHFDGDIGVVQVAGTEVGLLDRVNDAGIEEGVGGLDDLDVLGQAVAVDGEGEADLGVHGLEGGREVVGELNGERPDEGGGDDSGTNSEVRGGGSSVVRGRSCMCHCGYEHRREHERTCEYMTHDLPP